MDQRISIVTLGVDDLARARGFYAALGWRGQEVEETVFFQAGPLALVLWDRGELAAAAGASAPGPRFGGVVVGQTGRASALSRRGCRPFRRAQTGGAPAAGAARGAAARAAGATVTREPGATFYGGYAGVFLDPDGHAWEVAFNPGFPLDDSGALILPEF